MNRTEWENSSCSCHLNPPCGKCMNTCPDCQGYVNEDGVCEGTCEKPDNENGLP